MDPILEYLRGRTTKHGLFLGLLSLKRADAESLVRRLAIPLRSELRSFALDYTDDTVIINGPRPDPETLGYARGLQERQ